MYISMYKQIYKHVCIYIHIFMYIYISIYTYTHIFTGVISLAVSISDSIRPLLVQVQILQGHCAAKFTIKSEYRAELWEFLHIGLNPSAPCSCFSRCSQRSACYQGGCTKWLYSWLLRILTSSSRLHLLLLFPGFRVYVCMCVWVGVYVYMCVCTHVCI